MAEMQLWKDPSKLDTIDLSGKEGGRKGEGEGKGETEKGKEREKEMPFFLGHR